MRRMKSDILGRIDAWNKASAVPERTSSFLRDANAPTAGETDKENPEFGPDARNSASKAIPVVNQDGKTAPRHAGVEEIKANADES